jgi:anaerobic magnesium-protoporphyrin IX monomethyl ester cyclase
LAKKIILINPPYSDSSQAIKKSAWRAMPAGLLYLAGILEKKGHRVKIIDMEAMGSTKSDIKIIIKKEDPFFVGITATTPVIKRALELCAIVKETDKDIKTVLGGPHPTYFPRETIAEEAVDIVVCGEGEITICELMDPLLNNPDGAAQVKGIYFKKNGQTIFTGEREPIDDLDILPFPARHLIDMNAYHHPLARSKRAASVLTSRGCPSRCTFCSRGVFSHRYRTRSVRNDSVKYCGRF